jgi:DNA mismatch endonuclease (patch repair protein)
MPDVFDPQKRSEVMSKIRSKNTKAEVMVFKYLRQQGVYFQKHYKRAPGTPDIALPRKKKAIFIDGDFWHGKTFEALYIRRGRDDNDPWIKKIRRNMERDAEQRSSLLEGGWGIFQIWEQDLLRTSTRQQSLERIKAFLTN